MTDLFLGKFSYKLTFDFRRKGKGPEDQTDWETLGVASYSRVLTDYLTATGRKWAKEREVVYLEDLGDAMMVRMLFAERLVSVESVANSVVVEMNDNVIEDEAA